MKGGISICLAASKGGVGKTTLTCTLAVRASQESERVALLDVDPQHSTARWWELRGKPSNPRLFTHVENVADDIALLKSRGWQWIMVDTPGSGHEHLMEPAVLAADFVLIPCKASGIDAEAIVAIADLCRRKRKPYAIVISDVEPKWKISASAAELLEDYGRVLPIQVAHRQAHLAGMSFGKTGAEYSDKKQAAQAAQEIDALWVSVRKLAMASVAK